MGVIIRAWKPKVCLPFLQEGAAESRRPFHERTLVRRADKTAGNEGVEPSVALVLRIRGAVWEVGGSLRPA